jgi:prevent-host-death family protein
MGRPTFGTEINVADDIVPIAEFKAHLSEVVRSLAARRRPYIVTQNGKPAAVLLSPAEFDRLAAQAHFVAAVEEGLADVAAGRTVPDAELGKVLDARFGARPKRPKARRTRR